MQLIRHIPLPRSLQQREKFWRAVNFLCGFSLVKRLIFPVLLEMVQRDLREYEYWKRIHSRARIQSGYHNSLNGGRDQKDWLEESFGNLTHFLTFGRPPSWMYIQHILEDEETPIGLRIKTNLFVFVLRVRYLMLIKVPTWWLVASVVASSLIFGLVPNLL